MLLNIFIKICQDIKKLLALKAADISLMLAAIFVSV